jgi:hypothetical protein
MAAAGAMLTAIFSHAAASLALVADAGAHICGGILERIPLRAGRFYRLSRSQIFRTAMFLVSWGGTEDLGTSTRVQKVYPCTSNPSLYQVITAAVCSFDLP